MTEMEKGLAAVKEVKEAARVLTWLGPLPRGWAR